MDLNHVAQGKNLTKYCRQVLNHNISVTGLILAIGLSLPYSWHNPWSHGNMLSTGTPDNSVSATSEDQPCFTKQVPTVTILPCRIVHICQEPDP